VIAGRSVEAILTEWREAERTLAAMSDSRDKLEQDARIALLREEHRLAMAQREVEMAELRQP
jgi:phage shock protein A